MPSSGPAGPGFPTFIEEKPVGYFDKPSSLWQRLPYRSDTGGVSPMWLEGRESFMNERMRGMTPERRAWRKQFLADQVLSPREPVFVPELYCSLYNPIRRFFRYPFKRIFEVLKPKIGHLPAKEVSLNFRVICALVPLTYIITYWAMFYQGDWRYWKRGRIQMGKPVVFPGDPDFPFTSKKSKPEDYFDFGFMRSEFYKSEKQIREEHEEDLKKRILMRP